MGYESKIFIVSRRELESPKTGEIFPCAIIVATYDLCSVGWDNINTMKSAFKREIDYTLFLPGCDSEGNERIVETDTDCYGDHMRAATLPDLIETIKALEQAEHYRRYPPLLAMLEAFNAEVEAGEWDGEELQAVHYGY